MGRHEDAVAGWEPSVEQRTAVAEVCAAFGLGPWAIASRRRRPEMIQARFAGAWLIKLRWPELSWPKTAKLMGGRDHSTIMHAHRRAAELRESDPGFRALTDALAAGEIPADPIWVEAIVPEGEMEAGAVCSAAIARSERRARSVDRTADSWRPGMLILGSRKLLGAIRRAHPERVMEAA